MIFVGDIALPHKNAIRFINLPAEMKEKKWFGNLEGGIVDKDHKQLNAVYNHKEAIEELLVNLDFLGFALANNHILDIGALQPTTDYLKNKKVKHCGADINLDIANKELVFEENGVQVVLVNFGWEVIQCEIAKVNKPGVNPLKKNHVLQTISKLKKQYPNAKLLAYMHWSYELEAEPQPFERELAKTLVDLGVSGVIGSHPHRVGGVEIYKNSPIVYSLGNWMFKQNHYFDGNLNFPDFCNLELAFEWNFSTDNFKFHFFEYNRDNSIINYLKTEDRAGELIKVLTPFCGMSEKEYNKWYVTNHYHKRKGLPIYYWNDKNYIVKLKNIWMKYRDIILKLLFNKGK